MSSPMSTENTVSSSSNSSENVLSKSSVVESMSVSVQGETPTYRSDSTTVRTVQDSSESSSYAPISKRELLSGEESDGERTLISLKTVTYSDDSEHEVKPPVQASISEVTLFGEMSDFESDDGEPKEKMICVKKEEKSDSEVELEGIVMANPDELEEHYEQELEDDKELVHDVELNCGRVNVEYTMDPPYFVRMPNFLSVATHPFDENEYEPEGDDEQVKSDQEGKNRLKLKVENTIRWRTRIDENGQEIRESNAKIVKWDDGTMSLYLGNEIFEINEMTYNKNYRPHLYVQQPGFMSAQSVMTHRMIFRPHSTESKTHRKMTLNMADRSRSRKNVLITDDLNVNPEIASRENARKEEEAMRRHLRNTHKIRNNFKVRRAHYYGGSNSDEDMPRRRANKKEPSIIGASDDEDEDVTRIGSESDSDKEYRQKKLLQKKHIVTSDEEDSD